MIRNCVNLHGQKTRFNDREEVFVHLCTVVFMDSHAGLKSAEIIDLGSKNQIGELSIRQEDDEEHDGETHKVLGTARHSGGELTHGLVEVDELKKLRGEERPVNITIKAGRFRWSRKQMRFYTLTQEKKTMIAATLLNWTCRWAKVSKLG